MTDLIVTAVLFIAIVLTLFVGMTTGSVWLGGLSGVAVLGAFVAYVHYKDKKRQ